LAHSVWSAAPGIPAASVRVASISSAGIGITTLVGITSGISAAARIRITPGISATASIRIPPGICATTNIGIAAPGPAAATDVGIASPVSTTATSPALGIKVDGHARRDQRKGPDKRRQVRQFATHSFIPSQQLTSLARDQSQLRSGGGDGTSRSLFVPVDEVESEPETPQVAKRMPLRRLPTLYVLAGRTGTPRNFRVPGNAERLRSRHRSELW
jgi:hypothetical protein